MWRWCAERYYVMSFLNCFVKTGRIIYVALAKSAIIEVWPLTKILNNVKTKKIKELWSYFDH